MALWFPLMVNAEQIGEVSIVRREDAGYGEYIYQWTVTKFQTGTTKCAPTIHSDEVLHAYDDGAFELVRKVMEDYCLATSAERPAGSIAE